MASIKVPTEHLTLKGRFCDIDWEVWEAPLENEEEHSGNWGFSLSWGTPNNPGEYESVDLWADPVLARGTAFALIARWENEEIKQSDLASYCQHMEDSGGND